MNTPEIIRIQGLEAEVKRLTEAVEREWQPIASAPKGKWVLAGQAGHPTGGQAFIGKLTCDGWIVWDSQKPVRHPWLPTVWQPIPLLTGTDLESAASPSAIVVIGSNDPICADPEADARVRQYMSEASPPTCFECGAPLIVMGPVCPACNPGLTYYQPERGE